ADLLLIEAEAATPGAAMPAAPAAAEGLLEQLLEAAHACAAAARALEAFRPPAEGLERAVAAEAGAWPAAGAEAFEALEARLALGVDLAAVEGLALVVLAQDLVGGVELGEAGGGLGVVLVGVRMQLLGLLPERALDLRGAGGLRYPEDVIGGAHSRCLAGGAPLVVRDAPAPMGA